jgi:hypothetical protein
MPRTPGHKEVISGGECGLDGRLAFNFFVILMPVFYLQVCMKGKKCIFFLGASKRVQKRLKINSGKIDPCSDTTL